MKLRADLAEKSEESAKRLGEANRLAMELETERKRVSERTAMVKDAKEQRGVAERELEQEKNVSSEIKKETDAKLGEAKKNLLAAQKERDEATKKESSMKRDLAE